MTLLKKGDACEVAGTAEAGFYLSWAPGRIKRIRKPERPAVAPTATCVFDNFVTSHGKAEKEVFPLTSLRLRPAQPASSASLQEYQVGDVVDVLESDVWWHAVVFDSSPRHGLRVYFTGCGDKQWVADAALVRPGKIHVAGRWHPRPLPTNLPKNLLPRILPAKPAAAPTNIATAAAAAAAAAAASAAAAAPKAKAKGAAKSAAKGRAGAAVAIAAPLSPSSDSNDENAGAQRGRVVMVRRSARERESRLTMVDGKPVLKLNMYDLEGGERSVFEQELNRPKKGAGSSAAAGPSSAWVAVQHPAKRQKAAAGAAVASAGPGAQGSDGEGGGAGVGLDSPPPKGASRWNAEVLAHNVAVKADARAMQGQRFAFLDEHLEVLRPFISPEVAASIHSKAAAARSAGLLELPPPVEVQPDCLNASLREYQLEGLRWLVGMWDRGVNAILGDEMGLGKTLQTISLLSYLKFERGVQGPHLVVVPLSVLPSWLAEFERWSPGMRVVRLHTSDPAERARLKRDVLSQPSTFDVAVTTYEMVKSKEWGRALGHLLRWRYLVLDEGHRIKNEETMLAHAMRTIQRQQTLLLTGTPLQNNLHELYALLSYLLPDVFTTAKPFDDAFDLTQHKVDVGQLEAAHDMLRPFMLRRLKQEVELGMPPLVETRINCPLSLMQTFWYRRLLLKDSSMLVQLEREVAGKVKYDTTNNAYKKLMMLVMQLRKCVNHPYLFPGAEPDFDGETTDESIVSASGKMEVLDRLLEKMKQRGHRVCVFSQFNQTLDILEDYMNLRGYKYSRLDGSTNRVQRMIDIKLFNRPGSETFVYLLNTRAGGLGVNLQTADTVVLFDSDWNPQQDLQAMARVHRIGQTKPVHAYRLCTEGTVEERIQLRAEKKLFLDQMVNRGSMAATEGAEAMSRGEVLSMLRFGCDRIFKNDQGRMPTDAELDAIIDRSATRAAAAAAVKKEEPVADARGVLVEAKHAADAFDAEAQPLSSYVFGGQDYSGAKTLQEIGKEYWKAHGRGKRERRERLVQVDGHAVLRHNMYDLAQGEPSVFEREAAGQQGGAAARKKSGMQIAGRDYDHQDFCQVCWDGGDLVCCDNCPAAYHPDCLGLSADDVLGAPRWSCPHHACSVCKRKSQAVGGMLFRCEGCPHAFCEDHLAPEADVVMRCARFEALGATRLSAACYVRCTPACAALVAALEADAAPAGVHAGPAVKQEKAEEGEQAAPAVKQEARTAVAAMQEPGLGAATAGSAGGAAGLRAALASVKEERPWGV